MQRSVCTLLRYVLFMLSQILAQEYKCEDDGNQFFHVPQVVCFERPNFKRSS